MTLKKYKKDDLDIVRKYSNKVDTKSYCYLPSNIDLWSKGKDMYIATSELALYVYFMKEKFFLMPFTEKENINKALLELSSFSLENNLPFVVKNIPEEYFSYIDQNQFPLLDDRDDYEYVYSKEKLITLSGKHLQPKRNHISQFVKAYPNFVLEKLDREKLKSCIKMDKEWINSTHFEFRDQLLEELEAIKIAYDDYDDFDFSGALIKVDDKIIAFTLGEAFKDELIVYFEKADTSFKGSYAMINREYLLNFAPNCSLVNRQEDVGIEGLRKAKESYQPLHLIEKRMIRQNSI